MINYYVLFRALGASQRIFELLDSVPSIRLNFGMAPKNEDEDCSWFDGSVIFDSVGFSYPTRPENSVLKDISFVIEKGKTLALVGPSGGGKSTIFSLIERFYDPDSGEIKLGPNNLNLKKVNTNWMHSKIAMVSQEPVLFGGSIKENISFGVDREVSLEEAIEAAKLANAFDFINEFEKGFDTIVGERGIRLSGGQKQRIAIARALLVNPRLLLLDEATSALDSESEHLVQEAIERAMKERTVCVIGWFIYFKT
jgi:ABC-type multidrug transport system fused ATPase/permease subunit